MKRAIIVLAALLFGFSARAETPNLDDWDKILGKRVKPTTIGGIPLLGFDYQGLGKARGPFDRLVSRLEDFNPARLKDINHKLAFWINAYNIGAVKMVLDHPGIKSLNQVGPRKGAVWDLPALKIGGKTYSLNHIEHQILRKLSEPRIHFAIVCASVSCPDIRAEAYRGSRLDGQLDDQTRKFLSNRKKGLAFDPAGKRLVLSKLFEWFGQDFGGEPGIRDFVAGHLPEARGAPAGWRDFEIAHFDYDWKLNKL